MFGGLRMPSMLLAEVCQFRTISQILVSDVLAMELSEPTQCRKNTN